MMRGWDGVRVSVGGWASGGPPMQQSKGQRAAVGACPKLLAVERGARGQICPRPMPIRVLGENLDERLAALLEVVLDVGVPERLVLLEQNEDR